MPKLRPLYTAIRLAVACLLLSIGLRTWLVMGLIEPVTVAGSSMAPTLKPGDPLVIYRNAWQWRQPRRWELVVACNPAHGEELCVKRIVGLPGETIALRDGRVTVDGRAVMQSLGRGFTLRHLAGRSTWQGRRWQLHADEYFLLGDQTSVSLDSRLWGPVPRRLFVGKPLGNR